MSAEHASPVVRYEREGDVAEIVVDRPPLNLYAQDVADALGAALVEAAADAPRALILRAEGKVFTGGVDVHGFDHHSAEAYRETTDAAIALTHALEDLPFPTLAAVHGVCLTWGLEVALACDLLIAADDARFGLVERRVGISPGMGGTQRMAERAGTARAREFVMTGQLYGAVELREWGVINWTVPAAQLREAALERARDLAAGPTLAMAATKRVVRVQADAGTRAADARIHELTGHLLATEDARAAVAAFLADGPGAVVRFSGR
jgi:enoyl-CoA hydratase